MVVSTNNPLMLPASAAAPEDLTATALTVADYDSDGDELADQPSEAQALALADELDARVEVLSLRTESATVVAEPAGTLTREDFGAPVRVRLDDASWADVDYDLEQTPSGQWVPKASPADVVVGGSWNGQPEAARVDFEDGSALAVSWPGDDLGEAVVDGGVATYPVEGYSGSVDLVVSMTTSGVSTWLRINEPLTATETAEVEAQGVTFGLRTTGGAELATAADAVAADPTIEARSTPTAWC